MHDRLLYEAEAAALVGVKPATIRKWVQRGKLAAFTTDDNGVALYLCRDVYEAERARRVAHFARLAD